MLNCITESKTYCLAGCEYGDKADGCADMVKSQADSPNCYYAQNNDTCCEACGKLYDAARVGKILLCITCIME